MKSTSVILTATPYLVSIQLAKAFTPPLEHIHSRNTHSFSQVSNNKNDNDEIAKSKFAPIIEPLIGLKDMFQNFDDVVDDFFNKRMGNGEIFYGKRKYKPSGNVEGDYNGFGISDFQKIEATKERKQMWLEEQQWRREMEELKRQKEKKEQK